MKICEPNKQTIYIYHHLLVCLLHEKSGLPSNENLWTFGALLKPALFLTLCVFENTQRSNTKKVVALFNGTVQQQCAACGLFACLKEQGD